MSGEIRMSEKRRQEKTGHFGKKALRLGVVCLALAGLTACDTVGDMFSSDGSSDVKLKGERLSVMELGDKLEVDPLSADEQIVLPKPYDNKDWPQPGGAPDNAMYHLAAPGKLDKVWSADAGEGTSSEGELVASPIVADGRVYVLDTEATVRAFSLSGDRDWKTELVPDGEDAEEGRGGGIAFNDGKVFVTTGFGEVHALNAATGKNVWTKKLREPFRAAPTVNGGRVFAITSDNQLIALDEKTGAVLWRHRGIAESAGIVSSTSPAVAGSIVVVPYSSGELFAIRVQNGTPVWSDSLTRTGNLTSLSSLNDIAGRPVIDRDRVFAVSHSGRMVSIDLRTGERVWTKDISSVQTPWVAGDWVFIVTSDQQVAALSRRDGKTRWITSLPRFEDPEDRTEPISWSGPVLAGDRLVLVSTGGEAVSLSPYSGKIEGRIELDSGSAIAPVFANGTMYILTDDAELTAYK